MASSLAQQIACVKPEIRMRENAYPRFVDAHKMRQENALREIATMRDVLATLESLAPKHQTLEICGTAT